MRHESETLGVTIVYATHIFDGLDDWPTHLGFVAQRTIASFGPIADYPDLLERRASGNVAPLLRFIEAWMRAERASRIAAGGSPLEKAERVDKPDELRGEAGNG